MKSYPNRKYDDFYNAFKDGEIIYLDDEYVYGNRISCNMGLNSKKPNLNIFERLIQFLIRKPTGKKK